MDTREAVPNEGFLPRSVLPLIWGFTILQVAVNAASVIPPIIHVASGGASDFSIFYTGARILHFGWRHELYNLSVQARFHSAFYRYHPLPYNHLAYELLIFLPLAGWKFSAQYYAWLAANLGLLASQTIVLSRVFTLRLLRRWVFLLFVALAFPPIAVCLLNGQDTLLLTLIYSLTYSLLKRRRDFLAGAVLSLGLFKFHLILPFVLPMLFRRYWAFVRGFLCGATALIGLSIIITGFGGFLEYVALLRLINQRPDIGGITPVLMPNLRGLLTVLTSGKAAGDVLAVLLSAITVGIAVKMMVSPLIRDHRFDSAFAVNVTSVILVSYHLYLHDLSLLLLAILLGLNVLNYAKTPVFFWCTVAVSFCMPIYAEGLSHMRLGLMTICIIAFLGALIAGFPKVTDQLPPKCVA